MREQRTLQKKFSGVKTLGDSSDEDEGGAGAWVQKSRTKEQQKKEEVYISSPKLDLGGCLGMGLKVAYHGAAEERRGTGARPMIRNPGNKKTLTHMGFLRVMTQLAKYGPPPPTTLFHRAIIITYGIF
jgi:hypothetical protein